jgi:DNA-binding MarR family transcriptional regulator
MKARAIMLTDILDDIRRVFQVLAEHSQSVEHETGLTPSQFKVVKMLEDATDLKVSDLAKRMYLHPATMVGLLDRLEAKGLVQRTRSATDRRVVHICLTDGGRELLKNSPNVSQITLLKGLESLTTPQIEKISKGMEQLVKVLGAQETPPHLIMSSQISLPQRRRNP